MAYGITPPEIVHEAVAFASAMRTRNGRPATGKAAERYGVAQATMISWVHMYCGLSVNQIAQARRRAKQVQLSDRMYGIRPMFRMPSKVLPRARARQTGWIVSVRREGRKHSRYFPFWRYAGRAAALHAAQEWRDRVVATHRTPHKRVIASRIISINTSGVSGVSRYVARRRRKDGSISIQTAWIARKPCGLPGKMTCRSFSIPLHGEHEAFRQAVKARKAWEAELRGHYVNHPGIARVYAKHEFRRKKERRPATAT